MGYASYIVARTYTEKVGLIDWRIGEKKKEGKGRKKKEKKEKEKKRKKKIRWGEKIELFSCRSSWLFSVSCSLIQSQLSDFKASNDFCFTIGS